MKAVSRPLQAVLIACIVLLALAAAIWMVGSSTPWGRYCETGIAVEGDCYWEFSGGKLLFIYEGGTDSFGTYSKTNGTWFWKNTHGRGKPTISQIECSWRASTIPDSRMGAMNRCGQGVVGQASSLSSSTGKMPVPLFGS
jgi:hypothetical protein